MPPFAFFRRHYPERQRVLLRGRHPVLVDTGYLSGVETLEAWLHAQGTPADALSLIVNTHHHSDHVGGNHHLQSRYGIPIAAHRWEADLINRGDPEACGARWLHQTVQPYSVDRPLSEGDVIDTGDMAWRVIALPGHTLGQIGLHAPSLGVVILGDAVHGDDVGWLNPYRESTSAFDQSLETLAKIAALQPKLGLSGHGDGFADVQAACAAGTARLQRWRTAPRAIAWHASKRIFAHALIVAGGMTETEIAEHLMAAPWFHDHALHAFGQSPQAFLNALVAEMLRSGAARWQVARLTAAAANREESASF